MTTTSSTTEQQRLMADEHPEPTPVNDGGDDGDVEVIPPADPVTGEIVPAQGPTPATTPPVSVGVIPSKALGGLPYAAEYMRLAKTIHRTEMVPKDFQGRPDAISAAMLYGYELGLGPMQALSGINLIQGRPSLSAELMRALMIEQGHMVILNQTNEVATIRTRRKEWPSDEPTVEFSWTIEDGKRAGLVEWHEKWTKTERGGNRKLTWNPHGDDPRPEWATETNFKRSDAWANYTRAMLGARVTSECARALYPDVLAGMSYTPEEIRDFTPTEQEAPPPTPADHGGEPA